MRRRHHRIASSPIRAAPALTRKASNSANSPSSSLSPPVSPTEQNLDWAARPWEVPVKHWKQHHTLVADYWQRKRRVDYAFDKELETVATIVAASSEDASRGQRTRKLVEEAYPDVITPPLKAEDTDNETPAKPGSTRLQLLSVNTQIRRKQPSSSSQDSDRPTSARCGTAAFSPIQPSSSLGHFESEATEGGLYLAPLQRRRPAKTILSPKLTRTFTSTNADKLRHHWAREKMEKLRAQALAAAKAPILARLEATALPRVSCAEQEKLRVAIFSPDSAKTGQSAATQATLSSQEIVQTQVNPLPLVSTASNESRAKTEAFDVDPLTPRSAKSFEQSLKLQHELAKGVRAGAAAAVAKVKLLKATLMIQRVSRGMIARNGFAAAVTEKLAGAKKRAVEEEMANVFDKAEYFDPQTYHKTLESHGKSDEQDDEDKYSKMAEGQLNSALESDTRERLRRQERALYISAYRAPAADAATAEAVGGYDYALQVIEKEAKRALKSKFKELDVQEKRLQTKKVFQDKQNTEVMQRELRVLERRLSKFNVRRASEQRLLGLKESHADLMRLARRGNERARQEMARIAKEHASFKRVLKAVKVGAAKSDKELAAELVDETAPVAHQHMQAPYIGEALETAQKSSDAYYASTNWNGGDSYSGDPSYWAQGHNSTYGGTAHQSWNEWSGHQAPRYADRQQSYSRSNPYPQENQDYHW